MEAQPGIQITAYEALNDGTINYTCTHNQPGHELLCVGLSVYQGEPIVCERIEEGSMYGSDASALI